MKLRLWKRPLVVVRLVGLSMLVSLIVALVGCIGEVTPTKTEVSAFGHVSSVTPYEDADGYMTITFSDKSSVQVTASSYYQHRDELVFAGNDRVELLLKLISDVHFLGKTPYELKAVYKRP